MFSIVLFVFLFYMIACVCMVFSFVSLYQLRMSLHEDGMHFICFFIILFLQYNQPTASRKKRPYWPPFRGFVLKSVAFLWQRSRAPRLKRHKSERFIPTTQPHTLWTPRSITEGRRPAFVYRFGHETQVLIKVAN